MIRKGEQYIDKIIKYFNKNYQYKDICDLILKNYKTRISIRTLKRILKEHGLKRKNIQESPLIDIIVAIDMELDGSVKNLGYIAMWQRLKKIYKLIVKQKTVLQIMWLLDPYGVKTRKRNRLTRRIYTSPGPNFIWPCR